MDLISEDGSVGFEEGPEGVYEGMIVLHLRSI